MGDRSWRFFRHFSHKEMFMVVTSRVAEPEVKYSTLTPDSDFTKFPTPIFPKSPTPDSDSLT